MRKLYCLLLTLGMVLPATKHSTAQSTGDLITMLILDVEKLSDLKAILGDMYTGYQVIDRGYSAIKDIAKGNFNLHRAYLDGLLLVSAGVQHDPRVFDVINVEYDIVAQCGAAAQHFQTGHYASSADRSLTLSLVSMVHSGIIRQSSQAIDELTMVLTADELRMSDAERLGSLERIDQAIHKQFHFLQRFDAQIAVGVAQKRYTSRDVQMLQKLYGIQP